MATEPRRLTLAAFALEIGGTTTADVDSHIHAGLRSAPPWKSYRRRNAAELERLQAARDATTAAYRAELAAGRIIDPTPAYGSLESLRAAAAGHPDNPSTQAAQRLLAKRLARQEAART